jgi:two-component system chemotaxis response regulator CheY
MSEIRTLIVDDSSVMRKIIERALRQAGLDPLVVLEAGSGTEGLDVLKAQHVDLILSDINMPLMDGLEFLRQIRAQNLAPGVPVVMITTESSEEHVRQAIQAGAQGYIRKPFTSEQVKERTSVCMAFPLRKGHLARGRHERVNCGTAQEELLEPVVGCTDQECPRCSDGAQAEGRKWSLQWRCRCGSLCTWSPIPGTWMRVSKRCFI